MGELELEVYDTRILMHVINDTDAFIICIPEDERKTCALRHENTFYEEKDIIEQVKEHELYQQEMKRILRLEQQKYNELLSEEQEMKNIISFVPDEDVAKIIKRNRWKMSLPFLLIGQTYKSRLDKDKREYEKKAFFYKELDAVFKRGRKFVDYPDLQDMVSNINNIHELLIANAERSLESSEFWRKLVYPEE